MQKGQLKAVKPPPNHGRTVWFYVIARNKPAGKALSLIEQSSIPREELRPYDYDHGEKEGFGWLAVRTGGNHESRALDVAYAEYSLVPFQDYDKALDEVNESSEAGKRSRSEPSVATRKSRYVRPRSLIVTPCISSSCTLLNINSRVSRSNMDVDTSHASID